MRDQHRRKDDLLTENAKLRQQVLDLRDEAKARHRVEQHLRECVGHYRGLFELIPIGAGRLDRDGRVTLANRALGRFLGYKSGADLAALSGAVPVFDPDEWTRLMAAVPEGEEPTVVRASLRRKDGVVLETVLRVGRAEGGGFVAHVREGNGA